MATTWYPGSQTARECPYCHRQTRIEPGPLRGYCVVQHQSNQCTNELVYVDARTYFESFPVGGTGTGLRHVLHSPFASRRTINLAYWYRPDKYLENNTYLVCDPDLPRWTAIHRILGTFQSSVFTAGDTASDCATYYGYTGTTVGLRPKLEPIGEWQVAATYELDVTWAGGEGTEMLTVITPGSGSSLRFILPRPFPRVETSGWQGAGLVEAVTDVRLVGGVDINNFRIVADPPAVFARKVPIANQMRTPYVLPWLPTGKGGTMLFLDRTGRLWCVESNGEEITAQYLTAYPSTYSTRTTVVTGDYAQPSGVDRGDREITVRAVNNADGASYQWRTQDDGAHWTPDGEIT